MIFQAVIDDSGNEPNQKVYVLGGFLARADHWAAFTDQWHAQLLRPDPAPLDFYKFTQARALKGQFSEKRGWTTDIRDERSQALAKVVANFAFRRFEVSLKHEHFERYVRSVPVFERQLISDHPYLFMAGHVISSVATLAILDGIEDQIDFIFDEQTGHSEELFRFWPSWKRHDSPWGRPNIGRLIFDDETKFLPLQAADMWAGCVRHGLMTNVALPETNILGLGVPGLSEHMDEKDLRDFGARLLSEAERRSAAEPHRALEEFDAETAARTRKLNRKPRKPTKKERKALSASALASSALAKSS